MLYLLRVNNSLLAPNDAKARKELTELAEKLEGLYGKGKYCGKDGKGPCRDLEQLSDVLQQSRDWDALLDAWTGWHAIGAQIRPFYVRFVELANQGAPRQSASPTWASSGGAGYDMPAGGLRAGNRAPLGPGEAALRRASLLRARASCKKSTASSAFPDGRADAGPRPRQHVGAGVGQHLPAGGALQGRGESRHHRGAEGQGV